MTTLRWVAPVFTIMSLVQAGFLQLSSQPVACLTCASVSRRRKFTVANLLLFFKAFGLPMLHC